jgi:hypothetical protein
MRISELISKLDKALQRYGDINVTVSETLWLYNTVKSVRYIKNPYEDSDESVIEIVDYESSDDDWYEVL